MGCIGVIVIYCGNIYFLWNLVPNQILYLFYELILCIMGIFSLMRYEITTSYSFKFMLLGTILLGISHSSSGYIKFKEISSSFGKGISMLLYYSGQYILMHGAIHHSNLQN